MADEIDELYALPLEDFTSARNDLEKRLRKDGHRDEAAEVKALRKPTVPAWALNQAARRHGDEIGRLIEAGRRVRTAQEELLGGGDRKALDRASTEQRELSRQLVRAAVAIGEEAGTGTGAAFEEKVGATLRAAVADDEVAAQLAAGRLEREQEAVGLLGFGAVPEAAPKRGGGRGSKPAPKKAPSTKKKGDGDQSAAREAAAEERRTEAQERKRLRALETAQKAEARARKAADAAEKAVAKERETAARAVERLKQAEADEETAAARLKDAVAEVTRLGQEGAEP